VKKNDAFPSKYINGASVGDRQYLVKVSHAKGEMMGQGADAELKPVIFFDGTDKGIVIGNQVNWNMMEVLSGSDDTDNWGGTEILVRTEVASFGTQVFPNALRIKPPGEAAAGAIRGVPGSDPESTGEDGLPF